MAHDGDKPLLVFSVLLHACGPTGDGTGTVTGATSGSAETTTGPWGTLGEDPATTESADCPRRVEGDFEVRTPEDAIGLASVSGELLVLLEPDDPSEDLSFLACLESVGRLDVRGTPALISLDGLTSLASLDSLSVRDAPSLDMIRGEDWMSEMTLLRVDAVDSLRTIEFAYLEHLQKLSINHASALEEVSFPQLREVGFIQIGSCTSMPVSSASPSWTSLGGFAAIEEIGILFVESMYGLTHLEILDALRTNGGTITGDISIRYNPNLSEPEVLEQLAALGVESEPNDGICGNLDGEEECTCGLPD